MGSGGAKKYVQMPGKTDQPIADTPDKPPTSEEDKKKKEILDGRRAEAMRTAQQVPQTYNEMFTFNAAVMGFGDSEWMQEVLAQFDNIVLNASNSNRLQEECDVLILRMAKVSTGQVNLAEYKACMMASLRSLLPKDWTTNHEVAWSW